jgi:hypothetical protein
VHKLLAAAAQGGVDHTQQQAAVVAGGTTLIFIALQGRWHTDIVRVIACKQAAGWRQ